MAPKASLHLTPWKLYLASWTTSKASQRWKSPGPRNLPEDEAKLPDFIKELLPDNGAMENAFSSVTGFSYSSRGRALRACSTQNQGRGKVPAHDHKGLEVTVVLQGSFSDGDGIYREGDFQFVSLRTASPHCQPK